MNITLKILCVLWKIYFYTIIIVGTVVTLNCTLSGFTYKIGNRTIHFDGLLEIVFGDFLRWLLKV